MTRRLFTVLAASLALAGAAAPQTKPKLVVGIVIDQFRYDYLTRFRSSYNGGFARLLSRGAVFTNARFEHFPTVTAIGHSTFMTGATPSLSGIVGNEWFDREANAQVTSVSDPTTKLLGGRDQTGCSPRKLLVSTLGDEIKLASRGKARVIGISIKDRSAILPVGHITDGAYWFDGSTGNFVSSTFYFPALPKWVTEFNAARVPDRYLNAEWATLVPAPGYAAFSRRMPAAPGSAFYGALEGSPYGNEVIEAFAERAIEAERLGQHDATDLLTVSFSSNDYVGHSAGPDAPEVRDISIRTDRTIGKLLDFIDHAVGLGNVLVVLSADHGIPPLPEVLAENKMPGGRHAGKAIPEAIRTALTKRFGDGQWISGWTGPAPYFNRELIHAKKLSEAEVARVAADAVASLPHMFAVYTREQAASGALPAGPVTRAILNGFFPPRASDLFIVEEPYWIQAEHGTTHGSPFGYDRHVPIIFMGPNIKPGRYHANVAPNDIAPTLATMLDVETPSGSVGRVLSEMLIAP